MKSKTLYLFTRTPLHVGAGASVGPIDQPVLRERHSGFPIIPATSLKGSFADHWNDSLVTIGEGEKAKKMRGKSSAAWLFGSDDANDAFAGSLIFSEARVLAFPIRSAKGSYAWITCPLMLQRAARDGVFSGENIPAEPKDEQAIFKTDGPLSIATKISGVDTHQIVLEEYCFTHTGPGNANVFGQEAGKEGLAVALSKLIGDALFQSITERLVILSNGMMSHFVTTACEIAQHVRISDETGTAEEGGLFNQENVPSETLFYSIVSATKSRVTAGDLKNKSADEALSAFEAKLREAHHTFQFGGDASTGLGFCTVTLNPTKGA